MTANQPAGTQSLQAMASEDAPPPGFTLLPLPPEGFMGHNGPLYGRRDAGGIALGFRVAERHCNPMKVCHGGWIATMVDVVLAMSARHNPDERIGDTLLTVSMSVDYLGTAALGGWVEGTAQILRRTSRLLFVQGLLMCDGEPTARGSGVFRTGRPAKHPIPPSE